MVGSYAATHAKHTGAPHRDTGRPVSAMAQSYEPVLRLQAAVGNQTVSALLQRTIWVKNMFTDQVEPVAPGPSTYPVSTDMLRQLLQPGDRYDEANGVVTRLSGQQVVLAQLLFGVSGPASSTSAHMAVEEALKPQVKQPSREPKKSIEKHLREAKQKRRQAHQQAASKARAEVTEAARTEPTGPLATQVIGQIDTSSGQTVVTFLAV